MGILKIWSARRRETAGGRRRLCAALLMVTMAAVPGFAPAATVSPTILVLGDSLSAGYGLPNGLGWVDLLTGQMARRQPAFKVINASISGETTFGGRERLPRLLREHRPAVLVLALGANDGLRGTELALTRDNLARLVAAGRAAGARVVVVGMRIPPNYGPAYTAAFFDMFAQVARAARAAHVPFLLEGMAERRDMFQDDGIHPVAAAQPRLLANVMLALEPLLTARARHRP
jgi:acyl-CoA thioesterase-1